MIDGAAVRAVDVTRWGAHFVKPLYDSYCFARIPQLVDSLFRGDTASSQQLVGSLAGTYDRVILILVDAFGWRFLERYHDRYPFLQRIVREGVVTKLTSQFPSTTAAHVTTIHTGLEVGQSGVYEWFYYEPLVDAVIAPLLFSFAGDSVPNMLKRTGIPPSQLFPQTTFYQILQRDGIRPFVFQSREFTPSSFSDVVLDGAHVLPHATLFHGLTDLKEVILAQKAPSYYFLYFGGIDSAGHHYGPNSPQFEAEVHSCFTLLESAFHAKLQGKLKNTLFLMTADHGQVEIDPASTIYLNQTLPSVAAWLKRNQHGQLLVPAGSARDLFLHVREEYLDDAYRRLRDHLAGRAEVHFVRDLIDQGFFGSAAPSPIFLNRVGNLVILPYDGESVWWYERGRFAQEFYGHHGGLTRAEVETALLALPYG